VAVVAIVFPDTKLVVGKVSTVAAKFTPQPKLEVDKFLHVVAYGATELAARVPAPADCETVAVTAALPAGILIVPPPGVRTMPFKPPVYKVAQLLPDEAQA